MTHDNNRVMMAVMTMVVVSSYDHNPIRCHCGWRRRRERCCKKYCKCH